MLASSRLRWLPRTGRSVADTWRSTFPGGVEQTLRDADNFFGSYLPALSAWQYGPSEASAIAQPVLAVVGTDTQRLFAESHELLHAWFRQAEDCTIESVAHLLHLQRPEPVARGVAGFLARNRM